jgi:hypothetical protein
MKNTLTNIYTLLLAIVLLAMLYLYVFQWRNLPNLIPLSS